MERQQSKRSKLWEEVYEIVDKLNIVLSNSDNIDKPSVTTSIEKLILSKTSILKQKIDELEERLITKWG